MKNDIQEIQRKRFQFLRELYEVTNGSEFESVNLSELGAKLGFSDSDTDKIYEYLHARGLIENIDLGGSSGITHQGIVEVENAISKPDKSTLNFLPLNYIFVEQMIGSQIQQGSNQSSQVSTFTNNDLEATLKFVSDLRSQLPELKLNEEIQAEITSDIETIEAQAKSPHPKSTVIKECLSSIKTVLEGIAGNVIAALLTQQINFLLN